MPTPMPRALHGASVDARLETLMGWLRMAAQADYIGEDVSQLGHARVSELMNETAVLFKEKINFKLPGGSGFAAHQDAPAFISFGQRYHVTVLVTVDASDQSNGGLEFAAPVPVYQTLPQNADGTVADHLETAMNWRPLDLPAGSIVFFA